MGVKLVDKHHGIKQETFDNFADRFNALIATLTVNCFLSASTIMLIIQ